MSPTPGTGYSLKVRAAGSNLPNLVAFDSVNHTIPFLSTVMASGAELRVGTAYSSMYFGSALDAIAGVVENRTIVRRNTRMIMLVA
jgi:hypothetical protein